MEMQMSEVLLIAQVTEALLKKVVDGQLVNRKMSFKTKSRLIKASDKLTKELGPYEIERVELIKKFGEPIEEGKEPLKVKEEHLKEFYEALGEILKTTTELNLDYCKLTDEDVEGIEGDDINLQEDAIRAFQKFMIIDPEAIPEIKVG